jgi:hypothetical protein
MMPAVGAGEDEAAENTTVVGRREICALEKIEEFSA